MLLTDHERDFLAAFIYEATTDPFKGPATDDLHRRNIFYDDLPPLMTAYAQEGPLDQGGFGGRRNPSPPPSPWRDRDVAIRRDQEVAAELERIQTVYS